MLFKRIEPEKELSAFVECYWIIEDENSVPALQKIIPDGFVEIIFHLGDPYRIQLIKEWEMQQRNLLAGQITNYFYLENTGITKILGIKLKPAALSKLYAITMNNYTDKVVSLESVSELNMSQLCKDIHTCTENDTRIKLISDHFKSLTSFKDHQPTNIDAALDMIVQRNGMIAVSELCDVVKVGERQLENLFKKQIGLSPKFFSRIIRFNYICRLAEQKNDNWTSLAYEAAYFDQSHFIRNFKSFTGESPSAYSFDEKNMANFFILKK